MRADNRAYDVQVDAFVSRTARRWPLVFIIGCIGALFGLLMSGIRKPVYEAKAVMGINVQYGVVEPLELVVEDRALSKIAQVVFAQSTLTRVFNEIPPASRQLAGWEDVVDLRESLRLDRGLSDWSFVGIHHDPALAAHVAEIWLEVSLQILKEAQDHAWQAVALMGDDKFYLECNQVLIAEEPVESYGWQCDLESVSMDADALDGELRTQIDLSRGILPFFTFEMLQAPMVPREPILGSRGAFIFAGAMVGLIVGFWVAGLLPSRDQGTADDPKAASS